MSLGRYVRRVNESIIMKCTRIVKGRKINVTERNVAGRGRVYKCLGSHVAMRSEGWNE